MTPVDIPSQAPKDSIMPSSAEVQAMAEWANAAFLGVEPEIVGKRVSLQVIRQDYGVLQFGESCLETPITLGNQRFEHGLGTHANSEIKVILPEGAKTFAASIGIDNNYDTQGKNGSVEFAVMAQERELFRSPVVRAGEQALPVTVDIPSGVKEILLKVETTADGPACDQADWADAKIVFADGSSIWLDDNQPAFFLMSKEPPLSFTYGGVSSSEVFKRSRHSVETSSLEGKTTRQVGWDDPQTGLSVSAVVVTYPEFAAVEWVAYFENKGTQDTPLIEGIQALDVQLRTGSTKRSAMLHQILGDACNEKSFNPIDTPLAIGQSQRFAPSGGRSSNGTFPFFNLEYRDEGLFTAIGWSGQWAASLERSGAGPTRLQAGMEHTRLVLHPGERIRTPRILLMHWKGDLQRAHNQFRRLMLFHYSPRIDNHPVQLPVVSQCFDRYSWTRPEWATEDGQIAAVKFAHDFGCDTHWLDAAWFVGGFPNGVGNWYPKPKEFPNGLIPVSDACHSMGMKFVLWFEPERVAEGSLIAREHPNFVFGGEKGGLFKLNDPEARAWLADLLSKRIGEYGLDVYRNDFNIDPLDFWRKNDAPDREGMTEIRYIEGLYEMWDRFLAEHPGLMIDNCASGGRRIDLEMVSRSIPFWRSDTSCTPGHPDWNQIQTYGLSQYIPLFMACGWTPEPYDFRGSATAGAICQWDYMNKDFPMELAKATIAEVKENQKYWYGDFYPLCRPSVDPGDWMAYQFHRADLNAGMVLAFRHKESAYSAMDAELKGLHPEQTYTVEFIDEKHERKTEEKTGRELMQGWELRILKKSSMLIRYAVKQ